MAFDRAKLFRTSDLVECEVSLNGEKEIVKIKRLPAVDMRLYFLELISDDIEVKATAGIKSMAKAIIMPDGKGITEDELRTLSNDELKALTDAFNVVNLPKTDDDLGNA